MVLKVPDGFEDLVSEEDIIEALAKLKRKNPLLGKAVVKINEGFSGEGSGIFSFEEMPGDAGLYKWVQNQLPARLHIVAAGVNYYNFIQKFDELGGIVEAFIEALLNILPRYNAV